MKLGGSRDLGQVSVQERYLNRPTAFQVAWVGRENAKSLNNGNKS